MLPVETEFVGVPEPAAMPTRRAISFGPFRVLPAQQLLLKGDTPVRLGSRALEILIALVGRPGELVGKGELLARAWPDTVVEESNLKVQIAGLRRALGCGCGGNRYLATFSGRGHCFVAQSRSRKRSRSYRRRSLRERNRRTIWARITRLVGRVDVIAHVAAQLPGQRLLTIVGPGGIGKTAIANRLVGSYEHGAGSSICRRSSILVFCQRRSLSRSSSSPMIRCPL